MSLFSTTSKTQSATYEPGVDGLRALAVIAVLFFHAGFQAFSGGYIGVDVFFVISGYLITGILLNSCIEGKFSFLRFMARRIARLYPALLLTLVLCLIAGFLLFSPDDYVALADSSVFALFSVSNFRFWLVSGYFDTSSETNPLLHTWSLGVEQQFYLIWPFVIYLVYRLNRVLLPWVLLVLGAASLALSQWYLSVDTSANYYLTPFRVFEFAIGGLMVFAVDYRKRHTPGVISYEIIMAVGIALLLYSIFVYDKTTTFPGLHALVPAIGAALCIYASPAKYLGTVFRNRAMVTVGLISYSMYLIHWPLIVFYKYFIYRPLFLSEKWALVIAPFILGYLMYVLVENRYRRVDLYSWYFSQTIQRVCALAVILVPALIIMTSNGMSFRMNDYFGEHVANSPRFHEEQYGGEGFAMGSQVLGDADGRRKSAVLLGDSYARQYAFGLNQTLAANKKWVDTSFEDGCFFGPGYTRLLDGVPRKDCVERLDYALKEAKLSRVPLLYAVSYQNYQKTMGTVDGKRVDFPNTEAYVSFLEKNFDAIHERIGLANKLVIIGAPPGAGSQVGLASCVDRPGYLPLVCAKYLELNEEKGNAYALNLSLQKYAQSHKNVEFVSPYSVLCEAGRCVTMIDRRQFLYSDGTHLSKQGSAYVIKGLWPRLRTIFQK